MIAARRGGRPRPIANRLVASAYVAFSPARLPALRYERLADLPAVCVVDARHPLAGRSEIQLEELADQIFVLAPDSIGPGLSAATRSMCARAGIHPRTAYSVGYLPPPTLDSREMVGITAEIALDGVPQQQEIRTIRLPGHTLPVELIRRAGAQSKAVRTATAISRDLYQHAGGPLARARRSATRAHHPSR